MQLATTLKGVTPALVTPDTLVMGFLAQASLSIKFPNMYIHLSVELDKLATVSD